MSAPWLYKHLLTAITTGAMALAIAGGIAAANDVEATKEPAKAEASGPITVEMDHAKVLRIEGSASTVILGNPAVADAVVHSHNTLIITGRSYGTTNLIVLDEDSNPVADEIVTVPHPGDTLIQVHRRGARYSYRCAPRCDSDLHPGDETEYFNSVFKSTINRQTLSKKNASGDLE